MELCGSRTNGKPGWELSTSPTRMPALGTNRSCAHCWRWVLIRSRLILANASRRMLPTLTVLTRSRCITFIRIYTIKPSSIFYARFVAKMKHLYLRALQQWVDSNFLCIGAVTRLRHLNQWQKACVVDFPWGF